MGNDGLHDSNVVPICDRSPRVPPKGHQPRCGAKNEISYCCSFLFQDVTVSVCIVSVTMSHYNHRDIAVRDFGTAGQLMLFGTELRLRTLGTSV